jgi:hypothetical protein
MCYGDLNSDRVAIVVSALEVVLKITKKLQFFLSLTSFCVNGVIES